MAYKLLRKLSYDSLENYAIEVNSRTSNPLAMNLPFQIHPYHRQQKLYNQNFRLFYLPVPELSHLKEKLFLNSRTITELQESLPPIAQKKVFLGNLLEEVKSTNDIEGVQSSRKEINEAIDVVLQNSKKNKRFVGIVNLYMNFRNHKFSKIESVEDIRKIYDELLSDEIDEDKLPDGKLFRTDKVYVNKNGKPVHQGVGKGDDIESQVSNSLLELVNYMNSHEVPSLEKCISSHYYLEYIHPFYDGNGRLGRFIACSYLSRKLDYLSAISFSTSIKKKRGVYGTAFSEVSNPKNHGELTGFIIDMFKLLNEGQLAIIDELTEGKNSLDAIDNYFETQNFDELERNILFIMAQDYLFSRTDKLEDREIYGLIKDSTSKFSRRKFRTAISTLEELNLIKQIKSKPMIHTFSDSLLTKINEL